MKDYLKALVLIMISSLVITGCIAQTVTVKKAQVKLRPESDYKFEMRKTKVADVIERLGTPETRETGKDGYETLTYKAPNPSSKVFKYTVHTYTFTKKGLLSGHGKHGSAK